MSVKVQHLGQILRYCKTDYDLFHVLIHGSIRMVDSCGRGYQMMSGLRVYESAS
jgi:hypothetical protein